MAKKTPSARPVTIGDIDIEEAQRVLSKADPKLGRLMREWGSFELNPNEAKNPYESLLRAIVYQQLHGKAAATILGRVKMLFASSRGSARGGRIPKPQELLDTPEIKLRAAGLSRNKLLAVRDLAAKTLDGTVPTQARIHKLTDPEIVERLTQIRGVGQWTVEMMLMFQLGRPDVMPSTDFGVRSGFALTYGFQELPPPKAITQFGERWRPYRSIASWYMWRAVDLAKQK